ncbi:GH25 family lysozyme [Caproiciproducens galactitolivorans]|uniref:GH25 family lysozyme n=1 Tax=Caproiciproducens galactitolivorans TaxID=642589 RepID=A0ABT4BPP5_9FIRM|nr:GH25 family lysozyme [Caproiciproducens galactitolivorans]MCY1712815.1 GH25 family lysozyme [Caproiciproducens galactitolivorans]
MKKKLISLVLILAIIASFSVTAFATDVNSSLGTLTLDNTKLALGVGDTATLTASESGCIMSDSTWTSSDESVATVSGGVVTGLKLGRTTVTATATDGQSASCVVHVALKGIDVSRYQQSINWTDVKNSGVQFAIIRTGFGSENWSQQTDAYFSQNYDGATANGIKVGVYHFSYATTTAAAAEEARMCLSILNGRHLDYPVFYDIEYQAQRTLSREQLTSIAATFCSAIENGGYKAGIYSSPSFFNTNLSSSSLDCYDKWVASWGVDSAKYSNPYTVWQYGSGNVPGITTGVVDLNYSYVDYSSNGQNTTPVDPSDPNLNPGTDGDDMLKSDTTWDYTFGSNNAYYYKITTTRSSAPPAASSNPSAVSVEFSKKLTDGYIYKITNVGSGSALITTGTGSTSVAFTAYGRSMSVASDTTSPLYMKKGKTYQFKFTPMGTTATPYFATGNGSILKQVALVKSGNSYYYKVQAVGTGCTSVYSTLPGQQPVRQCLVIVS